jgi:hypothetical protein
MTKKDCIRIFNAMVRNIPVSYDKEIIPLVSDYLTEIKYENSSKIINLILQQPDLLQLALPKIIDYYCRKFNIFQLIDKKVILYYE